MKPCLPLLCIALSFLFIIAFIGGLISGFYEVKTEERVVKNETIIQEEWTNFRYFYLDRHCQSWFQQIQCDREEMGKKCYKYTFYAHISFPLLYCKFENRTKTAPTYYIRFKNGHSIFPDRPIKITFPTREYSVTPGQYNQTDLDRFFQFEQVARERCGLPLEPDSFCPHPNGFCYKVDTICGIYNELLRRDQYHKVTYGTFRNVHLYGVSWFLLGLWVSIGLISFCMIFGYCRIPKEKLVLRDGNQNQPIIEKIYPQVDPVPEIRINM